MAMKLQKEDIIKPSSVQVIKDIPGGDLLTGLNSLLSTFNTTMNSATKLLDGYQNLAEKLPGKQQQQQISSRPMQGYRQHVEPAQRPQAPPPVPDPEPAATPEKKEIPLPAFMTEEEKKKKAAAIFAELHEAIKGYIPLMRIQQTKAIDLIQMALQPGNKDKIIDFIAAKL